MHGSLTTLVLGLHPWSQVVILTINPGQHALLIIDPLEILTYMSLCFGSKHKVSYYPVCIEPNAWGHGTYVRMKVKFPFLFTVQTSMAMVQFLSVFMILMSSHYVDGQG